jgi:16S rRNA (uracil1498-N3)-methyltransferase
MARDPHPFLVPPECITGDGRILFPAEEAHHAAHVVRIAPGDECRVVDGCGGLYRVRLSMESGTLVGRITDASKVEPPRTRIALGFPVLRQRARLEWLLEKAVEVGADLLIPVAWDRSVKDASEEQRRRWTRIVQEAMKQSERRWLPRIEVETAPDGLGLEECIVLADPEGSEQPPRVGGCGSVVLLIGPEGGVTSEERERLLARGCALWSLGPNRLRAETAAIVGMHALALAARAQAESSEGGE